ncbi:aminotransferase class III-fold pyridoxal phosphate-dependent enzyme [Streptomyces sp. SID8366]|uniref:aspartate aminotransferase family protein n=1 Tax=unclassified Streptomyces TaxID=2593676 RepID=UPI000DB9330B|nr:aspartate aminotransferase family protein [Streptomyces sp. PsTaAH-130]MYU03639.1 aminotransferase class III-fold pyridoxal phosphate-dependent enzyme [Streptomyces sp. SID8366]MYU66256.1 aminotransferase class III-fold pyridoxal phosphate-dependent enzyme [Streptomyces sp. SID69]RAJ57701.1 putrescine aminotransferase [Streptomyces sp. PsTaAH-130]
MTGNPAAGLDQDRELPDAQGTFDLVRRHFSPRLALTGNFAGRGAVEVGAEGCRVTLSDGRSVLDFGSYAVPLLGHRHPAVVAGVRRALETLPTATRSLANPVTARAAATLVGYFEGALPKVYFGLNGADAVEVAVKLARLASGRDRVLAVRGAFHGKSTGALALTHSPLFRTGLRGSVVDVVHADPEDTGAVERAAASGELAAVVFEPVQGENGVVPLPPAVLRRWCADARRHGAFVVADEIQCGLRRCGERSVALAQGLPVDAVLVGKPLGGGVVPLSAVVCSEELYAPLEADPFLHSATFGGHPLACAALPPALAAIEQLTEHGVELADAMAEGLARLRSRHAGAVRAVRGRGLLWGVDYASPHLAGDVVLGLAEAGLLVSPCLSRPTTVRLLPSLACGLPEVAEAMAALDHATAEAEARCAER